MNEHPLLLADSTRHLVLRFDSVKKLNVSVHNLLVLKKRKMTAINSLSHRDFTISAIIYELGVA